MRAPQRSQCKSLRSRYSSDGGPGFKTRVRQLRTSCTRSNSSSETIGARAPEVELAESFADVPVSTTEP
jgi:hypothetical protein